MMSCAYYVESYQNTSRLTYRFATMIYAIINQNIKFRDVGYSVLISTSDD